MRYILKVCLLPSMKFGCVETHIRAFLLTEAYRGSSVIPAEEGIFLRLGSNIFFMYHYTSPKSTTMENEFSPVLMIIWLAFVIFIIAAMWKVFEKAGQPGWAAIIPIYNLYIMTKIAGKPGWWVLMFLIPFVNFIFLIWLYNMVSKSFGKDEGFTAGLVILGFIFWPILGFGSAKYSGPFGDPEAFRTYQGKDKFDFEPS
jgi:hypothetical protein